MFRVLLALLLTIAPMARTPSSSAGGGTSDAGDEWRCDGNPHEHCNPSY